MSDHGALALSVRSALDWLGSTPGSVALRESHYFFLAILTVHVLTLLVFAGMAAVIDLRLAGLMLKRVPASQLVTRLVPWAAGGLSVMIASGALLFYAAPLERFDSVFFRLKLVLLTLALTNVVVFHRTIFRRVASWDCDVVPPAGARLAGVFGLVLWAGIIVAGRMIPYERYWF